MRVVVQRCLQSSVVIDEKTVGQIDFGLTLLVAFKKGDTVLDIDYLVKKIINLRIFADEFNKMNKSILDVGGSILSVSQFTLYAQTKGGNRPSYKDSMNFIEASNLYNLFNEKLRQYVNVETGIFGSDMCVNIKNDGPVTIILESGD